MIPAIRGHDAWFKVQKKINCVLRFVPITRKIVIISLLLCATAHAEEWENLKGENFVVFYLEGAVFAQEVMSQVE